jgi:hypothetical protein
MWLFRSRLCLGFCKPAPDGIIPLSDELSLYGNNFKDNSAYSSAAWNNNTQETYQKSQDLQKFGRHLLFIGRTDMAWDSVASLHALFVP